MGTRRWSKFAKYLSRRGVATDIVCADYPYRDRVNWCKDVEGNPLIQSYPTPSGYPAWLRRPRRDMAMKLASRLLSRTTHRIDIAQGWGKHMQKAVRRRLADQVYDAVILTVPSFSTLSHFAALAREYPEQRFIVDYRDPWTYFLDDYGRMDTARNRRVTQLEQYSLNSLDQIWVTTVEHAQHYLRRFRGLQNKIFVLHNGFDPEDFSRYSRKSGPKDNMRAVFPGTLIRERRDTLFTLLKALISVSDPLLNKNFRIIIYTDESIRPSTIPPIIRDAFNQFVKVKNTVSPEEMTGVMADARFGLVLHDSNYELTVPVKIYDFLAAKCDIIYLGPPTQVSQQLKMAGHHCEQDQLESIKLLLLEIANMQSPSGGQNDFNKFRISELTDQLLLFLTRSTEDT